MTDVAANPTDIAICRLLAAGPLPTAALAIRLGLPERTTRHRLYRLRQAGAVVTDPDGLHHLAAPATTAPIAGGLPHRDSRATTTPISGPLPARDGTATVAGIAGALPPRGSSVIDAAAPVMAPDHPDHDGPSSQESGRWGPAAILAAVAFGLAAAAGIAIAMHRMASPASPASSPAPPALPAAAEFVYPGDPWGGMPW
jgi:hypothetical protein